MVGAGARGIGATRLRRAPRSGRLRCAAGRVPRHLRARVAGAHRHLRGDGTGARPARRARCALGHRPPTRQSASPTRCRGPGPGATRQRRSSAATPRPTASRTRRRCSRRHGAPKWRPGTACTSATTRRDIQAGRAAGMATLAAAWGYLGQGEPVEAWGADAVLSEPAALLHWLDWPKLDASGADLVSTRVRIRRRACRAPVRS
jgi:hypothetical protein